MDEQNPQRYSGTAIFLPPKPIAPTAGSAVASTAGTAIATAPDPMIALTQDQVIYGAGAFWGFVGYSIGGAKGGVIGAVGGALYKRFEFRK
jgi:hypothetical protein